MLDPTEEDTIYAQTTEMIPNAHEVKAPEADLLPIIKGRYKVKEKLGEGGMGAVYLAEDSQERDGKGQAKKVAIKVLLTGQIQNEVAVKKFELEIKALERIKDPRIVCMYDYGSLPDIGPYYVMEYIEGANLRTQIKMAGLGFERTANIIKQLGLALTSAHKVGVYHRDLKPENIMLMENEQIKVIDFGLAKVKEVVDAETQATAFMAGTANYMAPEHIMGKASASSDIYALSVIAYEMLTVKLPFNTGTKPLALMAKTMRLYQLQQQGVKVKPKDLCPDLPIDAQNVILKGLAFDPKARYSTAEKFGNALAEALTNQEDSTPPIQPIGIDIPSAGSGEVRELGNVLVGGSFNGGGSSGWPLKLPIVGKEPVKKLVLGLVVMSLIGIVVVWGWLFLLKASKEIKYTVTLWEAEGKDKYREPTSLAGEEIIFHENDKIRINLTSSQEGHVYVLNEAPEVRKDGLPDYTTLFPSERESSKVPANKLTRIPDTNDADKEKRGLRFEEGKGTEKIWLIWSNSPVEFLEGLKPLANAEKQGEIADPAQISKIKSFLSNQKYSIATKTNGEMVVKGQGDVIVFLLDLKYR